MLHSSLFSRDNGLVYPGTLLANWFLTQTKNIKRRHSFWLLAPITRMENSAASKNHSSSEDHNSKEILLLQSKTTDGKSSWQWRTTMSNSWVHL